MDLSINEQRAFNLLRNSPGEIQKIARPDGTINIDDLYLYYAKLTRELQYSQNRRRKEYIDIEKIKEVEEVT